MQNARYGAWKEKNASEPEKRKGEEAMGLSAG